MKGEGKKGIEKIRLAVSGTFPHLEGPIVRGTYKTFNQEVVDTVILETYAHYCVSVQRRGYSFSNAWKSW
jgi:hypothetical protein